MWLIRKDFLMMTNNLHGQTRDEVALARALQAYNWKINNSKMQVKRFKRKKTAHSKEFNLKDIFSPLFFQNKLQRRTFWKTYSKVLGSKQKQEN